MDQKPWVGHLKIRHTGCYESTVKNYKEFPRNISEVCSSEMLGYLVIIKSRKNFGEMSV
jgi:hypothetical protein